MTGGAAITVHGFSPSGNCHKVRLLLEQLGRAYRWVEVRSDDGSTRKPEFLALNPNGKVPLVQLDDGRTLTESNAILYCSKNIQRSACARCQASSGR